jgi:hypothetical protein
MTDDVASLEEVAGWLRADAMDCLYEWLRRTGPEGEDLYRVKPQDDGTFSVQDRWGVELHRFRITVLVEPPVRWDLMTWEALATWPEPWDGPIHIRLKGVEADLLSAVVEGWHVDPRSSEYRPVALEHDVVAVRIRVGQEEKVYRMPPSGQVEVRSGSLGEAVAAILHAFPGATLAPPPTLSES